jgi:hypothetical protein
MNRGIIVWVLMYFSSMNTLVMADQVVSDGSDGPFTPSTGIVTLDLPEDGIFNFTTIDIPAGTLVKFNRNVANTPVFLAATGDVNVAGTIDVSAVATDVVLPPVPENPKRWAGPGGGDGGAGATGNPTAVGEDGLGPGGGGGGYSAGGAGNATPGNVATRYSTTGAGFAGPAVSYPGPLAGGSGGGGGSAINWFGWYSGGYGGGGGGALQISTPETITISGSILANGANGGWAYASALAHGGAGGGGSGGCIELHAGAIDLESGGLLQAAGGYGGGLSTQPYSNDPAGYSSGADGGQGYVFLNALAQNLQGSVEGVYVDGSVSAVPDAVQTEGTILLQNHPNPFNPRTTIAFRLPTESRVWLGVYDLAGRRVAVLLEGEMRPEGYGEVLWEGLDQGGRPVPSGTYIYRLQAGRGAETRSMVLIR